MNTRPDLTTWALDLAEHISTRSRDPRTKVGAVILRPDNTIASAGYNGFPKNTDDADEIYQDRDRKLLRTIHGEMNAILTARESLDGYTIYISPRMPCSNCAAAIVQKGIKKVVVRYTSKSDANWGMSIEEGKSLFAEAGVEVEIHE